MARYETDAWRKSNSPLKYSGYNSVSNSFELTRGSSPLRGRTQYELDHSYDRYEQNGLEVQTLQRLANSLREELSACALRNSRELMDLRAEYQARLNAEIKLRDAAADTASRQLTEIQQLWARESDRTVQLRQDLLSLRVRNGEEAARIQSQVTGLHQELDQCKTLSMPRVQQDIDRTRSDISRQQDERGRLCIILKQEQLVAANELRNKIGMAEAKARNYEAEVTELRRQLLANSQAADRETKALQDEIKSLKGMAERHEQELALMKKDQEEARRDAKMLSEEATRLEREMVRIRESNDDLRSSSEKLNRLVYGRRSVSPQKR